MLTGPTADRSKNIRLRPASSILRLVGCTIETSAFHAGFLPMGADDERHRDARRFGSAIWPLPRRRSLCAEYSPRVKRRATPAEVRVHSRPIRAEFVHDRFGVINRRRVVGSSAVSSARFMLKVRGHKTGAKFPENFSCDSPIAALRYARWL
jgi:hypothetical protein